MDQLQIALLRSPHVQDSRFSFRTSRRHLSDVGDVDNTRLVRNCWWRRVLATDTVPLTLWP